MSGTGPHAWPKLLLGSYGSSGQTGVGVCVGVPVGVSDGVGVTVRVGVGVAVSIEANRRMTTGRCATCETKGVAVGVGDEGTGVQVDVADGVGVPVDVAV